MLYGIGHVLSKNVFHETPKSSMEQKFKAGYMIKLDKNFKFFMKQSFIVLCSLGLSLCKAYCEILYMSRMMRKPAFHICENKDADQLCRNCTADQCLCFRYIDITIPLLPKSEISIL